MNTIKTGILVITLGLVIASIMVGLRRPSSKNSAGGLWVSKLELAWESGCIAGLNASDGIYRGTFTNITQVTAHLSSLRSNFLTDLMLNK